MSTGNADRPQSLNEEFANCISHGIALVGAVIALPLLVGAALQRDDGGFFAAGLAVFISTMVLLYLSSSLCHGLPPGRGKNLFEQLDHAAIYLFIAGSYTPFAISGGRADTAWTMLAVVWMMALIGVLLTLSRRVKNRLISTGLYVLFGWLVLTAALPLVELVTGAARQLLIAGGLAYTLGALFFLFGSRLRFAHLVWHLFVMAGSGLHLGAVLG